MFDIKARRDDRCMTVLLAKHLDRGFRSVVAQWCIILLQGISGLTHLSIIEAKEV